jgi:hypothetical protein
MGLYACAHLPSRALHPLYWRLVAFIFSDRDFSKGYGRYKQKISRPLSVASAYVSDLSPSSLSSLPELSFAQPPDPATGKCIARIFFSEKKMSPFAACVLLGFSILRDPLLLFAASPISAALLHVRRGPTSTEFGNPNNRPRRDSYCHHNQ